MRLLLWGVLTLLVICGVLIGISVWINQSQPQHLVGDDHLSALDKARIAETFHLRQVAGDQVMPGYGQADIPVIVYNEHYAFLVGLDQPADGWFKVLDQHLKGTTWEQVSDDNYAGRVYYRQPLTEGVTPQGFTVQVGDRWVGSLAKYEWLKMIMAAELKDQTPSFLQSLLPYPVAVNLLMPNSDLYMVMILHESYHAYSGLRDTDRLNASEQVFKDWTKRYDAEQLKMQANWQKELDLLAKAMQSTSDAEVRSLAQQFLTQRKLRRQQAGLTSELIEMERLKEWEEGMAKYVEQSYYRYPADHPNYQPISDVLKDPEFRGYSGALQKWNQEVDQISRMASSDGDARFYYSGFAQAVMLDRLMPGWKDRLFTENVWLEDLLTEAAAQ